MRAPVTDPPTGAGAPSERTSLLLLVVLGLIWGSAYPVIRYGIVEGATPVAYAAVRYAASAAALAAIALGRGLPRPTARSLGLSAALGLPTVGMYGLLLYVGEGSTSGGLASILIGSVPLLTAVIVMLVLPGESLGRRGYLALVVGFVGVAVLVAPPPGVRLATNLWGPLEVVGAAASFAIGSVLLRRYRPEGETLWGVAAQFAAATAFLGLVLPVAEPGARFPTTEPVLLATAYLIALPSVAGYALYFYLHHHVGPGRANVVAYVNPVAALSIGTFVFGEAFHLWEVAGFALVIAGLTLLGGPGRSRPRPPAQTSAATEPS